MLAAHADNTPAPRTRHLLITILGEMVRTHGSQVWTQTLLEALALFDIEPKAARQAVARLGQRGWLEGERRGRKTRWTLTPWASTLLEDGAKRIFDFGQTATEWDERWLLVMVSVPDSQRALRYELAVKLRWAGFGSAGQGVWLSPWTSREEEVAQVLADLGITNTKGGSATMFRAELGSVGKLAELASRAWDLPAVAGQYRDFTASLPGHPATPTAAVRQIVTLVDHWRRFPAVDPDLPQRLLPEDWPGHAAAATFDELHKKWTPLASEWWSGTEARYG